MVYRIASILLRVCGALALVLGLLFWTGNARGLIPIHMLLGILVVISLWVIGVGQAFSSGGSWLLAVSALLIGVLLIVVGVRQSALMAGAFHWVIQVIHLLLAVLAVGIGQISAARARNGATMHEQQPNQATY